VIGSAALGAPHSFARPRERRINSRSQTLSSDPEGIPPFWNRATPDAVSHAGGCRVDDHHRRFEVLALPHLDAAYNLARWFTHSDQDAQDVVQEAYLRALRYFDGFHGEEARPWLLQIVRHTCYSWLAKNRQKDMVSLDDCDDAWREVPGPETQEPHAIASRNSDRARINAALAALPVGYREILVLREMEDLPYKDIARIADIPIGTVMSRLARARGLMRKALSTEATPLLRAVPASAGQEGTS
jgi:RNA polymerase sigma-70 factor (ECF subfamily)